MNKEKTYEIDLIEVFGFVWARKISFLCIVFFTTLIFILVSYLITPTYQVSSIIAPVSSEISGTDNAVSKLGGLASLVGIGGGNGKADKSTLYMASFKSRKFARDFILENNLKHILFKDNWDKESKTWIGKEPSLWRAVNYFDQNIRTITINKETGLVKVSINWPDPEIALTWMRLLIEKINTLLRDEYIHENKQNLLFLNQQISNTQNSEMRAILFALVKEQIKKEMLSNSSRDFAYQVVDPAVIPDKPIKPKKIFFAILGGVIGGLIGLTYVWLRGSKQKRMQNNSE